ncbi:MAG: acyl-CoA dehydrogenase family protein [Acidimicrobiales bacterium]
MSDTLSCPESLADYRLRAREWLAANVEPLPRRSDGTVIVPDRSQPSDAELAEARAHQLALHAAGWAGITYPKEYGGQGLSLEHEAVWQEESAGYDVPTQIFAVSQNILGPTIAAFGTHEQKLRHISHILDGREIWLQLLSEPSGGSDLAGLLTRADRDGPSYILNGQKTWSTGAAHADFALCPARTRWDVPKHRGITMFIIDMHSPGLDIRPIRQINGGAEFCEEFLTDVTVSADRVLGEENEGWRVARGMLEIEHSWVGRSGGGGTRRPTGVAELVSLAASRQLAGDPGIQRRVAALHALARTHDLMSVRVSKGIEDGRLSAGLSGILKLGADIVWQRRAELGLDLAGVDALAWSPEDQHGEWARDYLTSRSASIAGGSDEIQRNNVGEVALGLPREPSFDRDVPFDQVPHN